MTPRPRPWYRGTVGFLTAAATAAIGAIYVFSRPHGPAIRWYHIALGVLAGLAAGLGAGAPLYWAAKKELVESQRADDEASKSSRLLKRRNDILTALEVLADGQSELFSVTPRSRQRYLWGFRKGAVDASARILRNLQELDDADIRVILLEYDSSPALPTGDAPLKVTAYTGRLTPLDMTLDDDSDFVKGMREFMQQSTSPFLLIHKSEPQREKSRLRLSDQADSSIRVKISSGKDIYGALCIDSWRPFTLGEDELHPPILTVAKLLAVGLKGS